MGSGPDSALKEITFGSMAGMIAKLFEHPFDLVKVRLQSQPTDAPQTFKGPLDCFKQTYSKEGWKGLYRGLSAPVVGAAMENATLFLVYAKCQDAIIAFNPLNTPAGLSEKSLGKKREMTMPELALAAAGAGAATSFVLTPIELIKCRMQVQMLAREGAMGATPITSSIAASGIRSIHTSSLAKNLHSPSPALPPLQGPFQIIASTLKSHGIRGLWLGQMGTLVRETGGGSAWFSAYELTSRMFLANRQKKTGDDSLTRSDLKTYELMLSGAAAGVSYNVILFPADSIKSAVQTWAELHPDKPRLGFIQMGQRIWRTRGLAGMYAGCGVTCLRSGPSSAMIFVLYETFQSKLGWWFD